MHCISISETAIWNQGGLDRGFPSSLHVCSLVSEVEITWTARCLEAEGLVCMNSKPISYTVFYLVDICFYCFLYFISGMFLILQKYFHHHFIWYGGRAGKNHSAILITQRLFRQTDIKTISLLVGLGLMFYFYKYIFFLNVSESKSGQKIIFYFGLIYKGFLEVCIINTNLLNSWSPALRHQL